MRKPEKEPDMKRATLVMVCGLTLLVTMGVSSIIPVLPLLAAVFAIPPESSWKIIVSFAFPGLVCIPFVGVCSDRFGRKKVLVPALLLFALGGVACMFTQTAQQLLLCRMLQGAGSAPLGLLYPTIIADTWQGEERVKAMSYAAMMLGFGTALSPALGGALAMINWRLPFLLPLLALPVLMLTLRLPLMTPDGEKTPLARYFKQVARIVRGKQTLTLLALTMLTFIMLSGPIVTCFPILAESLFDAAPWQSGLIIACASLAAGIAATRLPLLYRRFSPRTLFLFSCGLYTAAFAAMALAPALWWLVPPTFLYGLAQGINIPLVSILLTGRAADNQRAALMAVNALLLRLGQNIGPALFGSLIGISGPAGGILAGTGVAALMALLVLGAKLPSVCDTRNNTRLELIS